MEPKFNIDRPKVSDEEINKHKDFEKLVKQFKDQSIDKAKHDKSWWKSKKVRYATVIAGATVVCTVTYLSLFNNSKDKSNETITTQNNQTSNNNKQETGSKKQDFSRFVSPPSEKLNIAYTNYKVDNAKGAELKHPSSSKIKIPKKAFVDKNGKEIVGEVTISYREFHNKADIIAGGIPMAYDSAGKKYNLESAGMFDILGTQNGEPVFIKEEVKVEFASANPQDRFNQYYLDTMERNWKYLRRDDLNNDGRTTKDELGGENSKAKNTKKLETLKREIEVIIPKKIDSVKVVYTNRASALPKPKEPLKPRKASGKQTFNIDASTSDFPELKAFGNFVFELGDENKNYSPEMNEITWHDIKISEGPKKGVNYLLTLRYNQRVEKLIVYPVMTGNDLAKAQSYYQEKFEVYQASLQKRENTEIALRKEMEQKQQAYVAEQAKKKAEYEKALIERERNKLDQMNKDFSNMGDQDKTTRIFGVAKFGIYNSDCPHFEAKSKPIAPVFTLNEKEKPLFPSSIFMINHTKNMVYTFPKENFGGIQYDENASISFVVFAKNKIYFVKKEDAAETIGASSNKFKVVEITESSDNMADLRNALEI